jgi:hypothetical protein
MMSDVSSDSRGWTNETASAIETKLLCIESIGYCGS